MMSAFVHYVISILRQVSVSLVVLSAFVFFSCEENIPLPSQGNVPDKYVISAQLDNYFGASVTVQKLLPYTLKGKNYDFVKPDYVKVIDHSNGDKEITFTHKRYQPFKYERSDSTDIDFYVSPFKAKLGGKYTMEVKVGDKIFRAEATAPNDSVAVTTDPTKYKLTTVFGSMYDLEFSFSLALKERAKYAQVAILQSQDDRIGTGSRLMLVAKQGLLLAPNTLFSAGAKGGLDMIFHSFYDTLKIDEVDSDTCGRGEKPCPPDAAYKKRTRLCYITLNEDSYKHLFSVRSQPKRVSDDDIYNETIGFNGGVESPANPVTNWSGGALGYFHAFYISPFPLPKASSPTRL